MKTVIAKEKTVSVDKFGRILVPKMLRDKWGLAPGVKVVFEEDYDGLKVHPPREACGFIREKGFLVADVGVDEELDVVELVKKGREERLERLRKLDGR